MFLNFFIAKLYDNKLYLFTMEGISSFLFLVHGKQYMTISFLKDITAFKEFVYTNN